MLESDMTSNVIRSLRRLRALWTLVRFFRDLSSESINDGLLHDDPLLVLLFCLMLVSFSLLHARSRVFGTSASLYRIV